MRVAILISGMPRSFTKYLWPFLKELPDSFHLYISLPKDQPDRYLNNTCDINILTTDPHVRAIYIDSALPEVRTGLTPRELNTVFQWYRLSVLAQKIPHEYDIIIRCRPDIAILQKVEEFHALFIAPLPDGHIYIPEGHNLCSTDIVPADLISKCINDQFAFGSATTMRDIYCRMYENLVFHDGEPLISEHQLCSFLERTSVSVVRIPLSYKLILSECTVITISGDSGSGKSTISKLLFDVFPYDKSLLFETDRYHKWDRGSPNYISFTHLNPYANHLDRLASDVFSLSIGEDIHTVDYDHSSGRFTAEERIPAAKYLLICGLHTNYESTIRNLSDLKIFIDTEQTLKEYWKIVRDSQSRGVSAETVRQTIRRRLGDYEEFISPQQKYANIVVQYFPLYKDCSFDDIGLSLILRGEIKEYIDSHIIDIADSYETSLEETRIVFCHPERVASLHYPEHDLKDGYDGILQYIFLCLLWST